jgi:hypothetical protein
MATIKANFVKILFPSLYEAHEEFEKIRDCLLKDIEESVDRLNKNREPIQPSHRAAKSIRELS